MSVEKKVVAPVKKVIAKKDLVVKVVTPAVSVKRQFDKNDDIEIMNNTTGRYGYKSRQGFSLEMNEYGDILDIPFGELKTMRSEQKRHIEDAFIVILDEDAVKELKYEQLYENVLDQDGVDELLQDPEKLNNILNKMPATMRETVGAIATRKFRSGELYDNRVKKVIEENLKIKIAD